MEKQILKKMKRYVELSKKFTTSKDELFGEYSQDNSTVTISMDGNSGNVWINSDEKSKTPTRAERIMSDAKGLAKLSDEYDEYIELGAALSDLFKANDKLK